MLKLEEDPKSGEPSIYVVGGARKELKRAFCCNDVELEWPVLQQRLGSGSVADIMDVAKRHRGRELFASSVSVSKDKTVEIKYEPALYEIGGKCSQCRFGFSLNEKAFDSGRHVCM